MFSVYVLYSPKSDRIYIGQTSNLELRLEHHNSGKVFSTKSHKPWQLIHHEEFDTRAEAMRREKELKSHRGRDFIRSNFLNGRVRQPPFRVNLRDNKENTALYVV